MALALPNAHNICLCPLHTPVFEHLEVQWFTNEYETETPMRCWVCCYCPEVQPSINGTHAPQILQPFIFKLISQISGHDCHLTADGYRNWTASLIESCWIEPNADCVSECEWVQSVCSIHHILDSIYRPWSVDGLIGESNPGPFHILLFYEPLEGKVCT